MKMSFPLFLFLFLFSANLFSSPYSYQRPEVPASFSIEKGKAVFVDFQKVHYVMTYDLDKKTSYVLTEIEFEQMEEGYPVFDLVEEPQYISMGQVYLTSTMVKTPGKETSVRLINQKFGKGHHSLSIKSPLTRLVRFQARGVSSAFWTTDLEDRGFLERYLPTSFEYDQYKMDFFINFKNMKENQKIYTNGEVRSRRLIKTNDTQELRVHISFPEHFNSSSVYFHTTPESEMAEINFPITSIDGRQIPTRIYIKKMSYSSSKTLRKLKNYTLKYFSELEKDYGPWPHDGLLIYNAGLGGMEYCGATMTSLQALGHEMFHSYFGRGVMPANGNAGWIDEALASWRDNGYTSLPRLSGSSNLSDNPPYIRLTNRQAYSFGARFMSMLNFKLKDKGGLKPFLRSQIENRLFAPFRIENFIQDMVDFYEVPVDLDFKEHTFSKKSFLPMSLFTQPIPPLESSPPKKFHYKMTLKELERYL